MTDEAPVAGPVVERAALGGVLLPWTLVSLLLLPAPALPLALALLALLGALLLGAATWSRARAREAHLDEDHWAALAVLTLGLAMVPLLAPALRGLEALCRDCGRVGDFREPFCFGCGSA